MRQQNKIQQLTLVGAGPGDPDLISVKGVKALQVADVILHDALVDKQLLDYAKKGAEIINVGKRSGHHSYKQKDINQLIVEKALQGNHVIRLKGGDPFIFGRGHEELTVAESFGIQVNIVPGITSATSVPAMQRIPLTKRGVNKSFMVVTATASNGKISVDLIHAAKYGLTAVILMGIQKIKQIAGLYERAGYGELPVAIISNGSVDDESVVTGYVHNICDVISNQKIKAPGIIVVGEVVAEHPHFETEKVTIERSRQSL